MSQHTRITPELLAELREKSLLPLVAGSFRKYVSSLDGTSSTPCGCPLTLFAEVELCVDVYDRTVEVDVAVDDHFGEDYVNWFINGFDRKCLDMHEAEIRQLPERCQHGLQDGVACRDASGL